MGVGGKGNEGVAGMIRNLPGSMGYIELIYALQNKINYGSVKNSSGSFVKASLESTTAAAAGVKMPAGLPSIHHQPAGQDGLSHRQLHLVADSHQSRPTRPRARW